MGITALDEHKVQQAAPELDDIEAYIATFNDDERGQLAAADAAIDLAILLYRARERRGLSQAAAAQLAGLQQQAVSRFEQPGANPRLETIQDYLGALGYSLELTAIDTQTGEATAKATLPRVRRAALQRPSKQGVVMTSTDRHDLADARL